MHHCIQAYTHVCIPLHFRQTGVISIGCISSYNRIEGVTVVGCSGFSPGVRKQLSLQSVDI